MIPSIELYRKRYIPDELIHLKDDVIVSYSDSIIVTKWDCLKPRKDINHGISAYYMKKGFKVSKIFNKDNELVYWYCDLIHTEKFLSQNKIIFHDLLIDVLIYPDESVKIVDVGEVADVLEKGALDTNLVVHAMRSLDWLLQAIYNDEFKAFKELIEQYED